MTKQEIQPGTERESRSYFARKLASDPALADRCEQVATAIRDAATEEIEAVERSERLSKEDFAVYINARADGPRHRAT